MQRAPDVKIEKNDSRSIQISSSFSSRNRHAGGFSIHVLLSTLAVVAMVLSASGCVGVGTFLGAAGAVASGAQYSKDQLAQKTFDCSRDEAEAAAKQALKGMEIAVTETTILKQEVTVHGETPQYPILVDLEPITPCLTKVTVTAGKTYFTLDRATGAAIVDRIGEILEEREKLAQGNAALAQAAQNTTNPTPEEPDTKGFRLYPEAAN